MNAYKDVNHSDLFFCYNKELSMYIYNKSGIKPITNAINPRTGKEFRLYCKSDKLQLVLDAYKNDRNQKK
ncbi:hypothetical protein [Oceanobacillus oncorhynchi]|uniref:hypothetical protein n=1 Tax=Oceanobacillus oncorhynchi TaxID=545501 RepID=UPI0034D54990